MLLILASAVPYIKKLWQYQYQLPHKCFAFLSQLWFGGSLSDVSGNYSRNMMFPWIASLLCF